MSSDPLKDLKIVRVLQKLPEAKILRSTAPTGQVNVGAASAKMIVKVIDWTHNLAFDYATQRALRNKVDDIEHAIRRGCGVLVRVDTKEWKVAQEGKRAKQVMHDAIIEGSGDSPGPILKRIMESRAEHGAIFEDPGKGWVRKEIYFWITKPSRLLGGDEAALWDGDINERRQREIAKTRNELLPLSSWEREQIDRKIEELRRSHPELFKPDQKGGE